MTDRLNKDGVTAPLLVPDFDHGIDFYCHATGLFELVCDGKFNRPSNRNTRLRYKHPAYLFSVHFCYIGPEPLRQVQALLSAHSSCNYALNLPVDDCKRTYREMLARGVRPDGELLDLPWGRQAVFSDPFGNRIILFEDYSWMACNATS